MVSLQYKGRIHKAKFTARSLRYILSDQAARLFPTLQRRWLFPVESQPIGEAAAGVLALPSVAIETQVPPELARLGYVHTIPLQITHHVYSLENVVLTGWAGAMIKDGLLLAVRPQHNWVSSLRARPYDLRRLPDARPYFNLMAPMPARGHIFHWLFDSIIPLLSYLESGGRSEAPGLIVNRVRSAIQDRTLDYLRARYGLTNIEALGESEAAHVPNLRASISTPYNPRALQAPAGLTRLGDLAEFLSAPAGAGSSPRKIYVSRNDARLRRVLNEEEILPELEAAGFERVVLRGMPIAQQVRLFRNAEIVAAPHGAGLAHIVWSGPGAKLVEIFPHPDGPRGRVKNATSDYWLIAQMRELSYRCTFAGPVLNRDDGFNIDRRAIETVLEAAATAP